MSVIATTTTVNSNVLNDSPEPGTLIVMLAAGVLKPQHIIALMKNRKGIYYQSLPADNTTEKAKTAIERTLNGQSEIDLSLLTIPVNYAIKLYKPSRHENVRQVFLLAKKTLEAVHEIYSANKGSECGGCNSLDNLITIINEECKKPIMPAAEPNSANLNELLEDTPLTAVYNKNDLTHILYLINQGTVNSAIKDNYYNTIQHIAHGKLYNIYPHLMTSSIVGSIFTDIISFFTTKKNTKNSPEPGTLAIMLAAGILKPDHILALRADYRGIYYQPIAGSGFKRWCNGQSQADIRKLSKSLKYAIQWYEPWKNECVKQILLLAKERLDNICNHYIFKDPNGVGVNALSGLITIIDQACSKLPDEEEVNGDEEEATLIRKSKGIYKVEDFENALYFIQEGKNNPTLRDSYFEAISQIGEGKLNQFERIITESGTLG